MIYITFPLIQSPGDEPIHAWGRPMADAHMAPLYDSLKLDSRKQRIEHAVILDYSKIVSTTTSYVKGSFLRLLQSGQLYSNPERYPSLEDPGLISWNVYPLIFAANDEIIDEFHAVLRLYNAVCLEAIKFDQRGIYSARLHGNIDDVSQRALRLLQANGPSTAGELHSSHPDGVSLNAWINRLNDLVALRLAHRKRDGRRWLYSPIVSEIINV